MRLQNLNQFNRSLILNRLFIPRTLGTGEDSKISFHTEAFTSVTRCRVNSCHSRCYDWASQWAGFDRVSKGINESAFLASVYYTNTSLDPCEHQHVWSIISLSLIPHQPCMHHVFRLFVAWFRAFMVLFLSLFLQFIISKITFLTASLTPREKSSISVRDVAVSVTLSERTFFW